MTIYTTLRLLTLILLAILEAYWEINKRKAMMLKPITSNKSRMVEIISLILIETFVLLNLLGLVIFPFKNLIIQFFGFLLVLIGFSESMIARKTLSDNWTESYKYQIKKNHKLITKGIYQYVRHPIYGGLILVSTGALLVSGSYTFIAGLIIMLFAAEIFAKREEKLLTKHFGKKYIDYMKITKKFIPFIY